jgi:hypothetical protein
MRAYIPSVPPAGRDASVDLVKYCRIVGLLFRGWVINTNGQEGWPGLRDIVDKAIQKRRERVAGIKGAKEMEGIVNVEGRMLMVLALKLERDTGVH